MESNQLDQLFRDGIDHEFEFSGQERQWKVVAAQLHPPSRRRALWWWAFGILLVLSSTFWQLGHPSTPDTSASTAPQSIQSTSEALEISTATKATTRSDKPSNTLIVPAIIDNSSTLKQQQALEPEQSFVAFDVSIDRELQQGASSNEFQQKSTAYTYRASSQDTLHLDIGSAAALREVAPIEPLDKLEFALLAQAEVPLGTIQPNKSNKGQRFTLMAGWQQSFTRDAAVQEQARTHRYVGFAAKIYGRWEGTLRYSQETFQRTTQETPATYNIPLVDVPVGFSRPDNTELRYERQALEVGVRHRLPFFRSPRVYLQSGVLLARNKQVVATYAYQNIYQNPIIEAELVNQPWHGAAIFGGATVEVPLLLSLSATAGYQFYRELNPQYLQWRASQQWQLGLSYHF